MNQQKNLVLSAWSTGTAAVHGRSLVEKTLRQENIKQADMIFAVGKAAASMCQGAMDVLGYKVPALVITKYDHTPEALQNLANVTVIEAGHPIPDQNSLLAGSTAIEFIKNASASSKLIVLISGGASALAEDLANDTTLEELQLFNNKMIAQGFTIGQINAQRLELSNIKGGKLLQRFKGHSINVYCISDVESDIISLVGSGLADTSLAPHVKAQNSHSRIIGKNIDARDAVANFASTLSIPVIENLENLHTDLFKISNELVEKLRTGPDGFYIWGGEPTIQLPENPGQGGRNQSLALAMAKGLQGSKNIAVIAAGTDGTDGPTDAAGGIIDGETFFPLDDADEALSNANAGPFLERKNSLFKTGPTGTNTMDLVIGLKLSDERAEKAMKQLTSKDLRQVS